MSIEFARPGGPARAHWPDQWRKPGLDYPIGGAYFPKDQIRYRNLFKLRVVEICAIWGDNTAKKSYADIALDMYEAVKESNNKQKRLKSSTFWDAFRVGRRTPPVIERISCILTEQRLKVSVKSGEVFGKENYDDWIELTIWPPTEPSDPPHAPILPSPEWFGSAPSLGWY